MISGNKERRIARFTYIDRKGDGSGDVWRTPTGEEEFVGIPYQWHGDHSDPFIEIRENGVVKRTINCDDVSCIDFSS